MLEKVSQALWSWWERVIDVFNLDFLDNMGGDMPESDSPKCPVCQHDAAPFASSSLGPVMRCTWCKFTFTLRKF